ncbi:MAG: DsbA family protein [Actinomycetota bacterium]|nr:DsbA family protein [Actinomycetota bacterium]
MTSPQSNNRKALYIVGGVLAVVVLGALSFAYFRKVGGGVGPVASYSTQVQGVVVVAGKSAGTTVDVYEDLVCPVCGRFESRDGAVLAKAVEDGKVQVKYHPVAILNRATTPTGYSTRAANAVICAADAGKFAAYHDKLFVEQPAEQSAGLTDEELIAKGTAVGAAGSFAQCVTSGKHSKAVDAATLAAVKDTSLRADGKSGFGTPTVLVNGKRVDWTNSEWLTALK